MSLNKDQDPEACEHILLELISFHKTNFCISYKCTKCKRGRTIKNIEYEKLDGKYGVMVEDEKLREPLKLDFSKIPELQVRKK